MKHYRILILLATAVAAVSCGQENLKQENPEADVTPAKTFSFTAVQEGTPQPAGSKAIVGINANEKPQTFWEDGDKITVFSKADYDSNGKSMTGYVFQTALGAPSPEAEFTFDGDFPVSVEYIAVYPYSESTKTVNFETHQMVPFFVPENQTLPAGGGFDKSAAVSIACAAGGSSLEFKNATALIKFRVADDDIVAGSIVVDDANYIAGTLRASLDFENNVPELQTYGSNPKYSKIDFTIDGTTPLSTGTDYYVAVRPTTLTNGFKVYINGHLAASYTSSQVAEFVRSKIYNISTPLTKTGATELLLDFDFTDASAMSGWPTLGAPGGVAVNDPINAPYTLYGTAYTFISKNPTNASSADFPRFNTDNSTPRLGIPKYRLIGLPAIDGYKLTKVVATDIYPKASTANKLMIGSDIPITTAAPTAVNGGEVVTVTAVSPRVFTFNLAETSANTAYWVSNRASGLGLGGIALTYTKVD